MVAFGLSLAGARTASAEPPVERVSYAWQTLLVDAPSVAVVSIFGGNRDGGSALAYGGLAVHALAAPIVHLVHGNAGKAAGSLGMRLGTNLIGALAYTVCYVQETQDKQGCQLLAAVPMIAASILDALLIANEDSRAPSARSAWAPVMSLGRGAAIFGIGGAL